MREFLAYSLERSPRSLAFLDEVRLEATATATAPASATATATA
jgi:hypothetical protein